MLLRTKVQMNANKLFCIYAFRQSITDKEYSGDLNTGLIGYGYVNGESVFSCPIVQFSNVV